MDNRSRRGVLKKLGAGLLVAGGTGIGTAAASHLATVTFNDQTAQGRTVNVARVYMPDGGFVAIHDESLLSADSLEEVVESVVGNTAFKQPGTHTDLRVPVEQDVESQTLIAMPHKNTNTSRRYDFPPSGGQEDGPYRDESGKAIIDSGEVTF